MGIALSSEQYNLSSHGLADDADVLVLAFLVLAVDADRILSRIHPRGLARD